MVVVEGGREVERERVLGSDGGREDGGRVVGRKGGERGEGRGPACTEKRKINRQSPLVFPSLDDPQPLPRVPSVMHCPYVLMHSDTHTHPNPKAEDGFKR